MSVRGKESGEPGAARRDSRSSSRSLAAVPEVLLVEDSLVSAKLISRKISGDLGYNVKIAGLYEEATGIIEAHGSNFLAAVVDLNLPDAPAGEIVDLAVLKHIPTIVLTGTYDEDVRERILSRGIVDYHFKDNRGLTEVNHTLMRLNLNPGIKVLVVDDSLAIRNMIKKLLEIHRFQVLEAVDGQKAVEVIEKNGDIMLVVTDYEMPRMDGAELVSHIRDNYEPDEIAVIGVSAVGSSSLSVKFLKFGADDFLAKPFQKEEFYCRIYRSIETVEHIRAIKKMAYTDKLTGLYNRLYFFKTVPQAFEEAVCERIPCSVAMLDIDHFKNINDTYGHAGGDTVLQHIAGQLRDELGDEVTIARFGGEEFCVYARGVTADDAAGLFEKLRDRIQSSTVFHDGNSIGYTVSIGVAVNPRDSIDMVINQADSYLYEAKENGRNQVIVEKPLDN